MQETGRHLSSIHPINNSLLIRPHELTPLYEQLHVEYSRYIHILTHFVTLSISAFIQKFVSSIPNSSL